MKLELIEFIKTHKNWEDILTNEPFCLKINRDNGYILFKYDQIKSDFSLNIVKEARGIILREKDFKVVCFPFTKFFNVDEPYADKIDWNTAKVQEKVDGSLIKVWCDRSEQGYYMWNISTQGCINAFSADINNNLSAYKTFGDLFMSVFDKNLFTLMDKDYTYMFELVSPYNKIVVSYPETKIYHIGTRNNITYEEVEQDIGVEKPKKYNLSTEKECKEAASELTFNEEGYVVVDKNYNRVKIKSPAYVNAHRLVNNHCINGERVLDLIINNDQEEFLSYFPEYRPDFIRIQKLYLKYGEYLDKMYDKVKGWADTGMERKEFALKLINKYPNDMRFGFLLYDNNINSCKEYLEILGTKKIFERIKLYEC